MAWGRYYRRYSRYRRYPARRYWRRYYRSRYARKYVNASSKSSVRMKTAVNGTFNATAGYGNSNTGATLYYFNPYSANTDTLSAANSPLYRTYCNLYEEVKMIGAKVNMSIVSAVGGSDIPSVQIYSCWDRKHGYGEAVPTVSDVRSSSTSNVATALNNNVAKLTRSCYASDLMEKATWIDSTLDETNNYRNIAWTTAATNPNMFCPTFMFFLNCPSLGATTTISVSMSIVYYFAFRNPRYGGTPSTAKVETEMLTKTVPNIDDDMDIMMMDELEQDDRPQVRAKHTKLLTDTDAGPLTAGKRRYQKNGSSNHGQTSGD